MDNDNIPVLEKLISKANEANTSESDKAIQQKIQDIIEKHTALMTEEIVQLLKKYEL